MTVMVTWLVRKRFEWSGASWRRVFLAAQWRVDMAETNSPWLFLVTQPIWRSASRALYARVSRTSPVLAGVSFQRGALSISIGVACLDPRERPADVNGDAPQLAGESLFKAADRALYDAKQHGRNRASVAR